MAQGSKPSRSRRIKLTYLITDLKVGGVPLHLFRLATRLPREEFDIRVISLADQGPVGELLGRKGIAVEACGAGAAWQIGALGRLWHKLAANPPDVLHAMLFHANMASRLVGPCAGIRPGRIINEIQTVEIERRWHLLVDGLTCRLCRFEVGNSPSVIEHLHEQARIPRQRLRCMWGAVDAQAISQAMPSDRRDLGVEPQDSLLLWTGRLDPVKGFEEMLEAVGMLSPRHRFKLLLVGDGPYRSTVEDLVRRHGLDKRVRLLGSRDDVPRLLASADLFVFCSRTEGLPNSLLEAMAAGLPIVTTRVPGCRDLIKHMETGVLAEARSPQSIARGIDTLLSDAALACRLGQAARDFVWRHADLSVWLREWTKIYSDIARPG